MGVMRDFWEDHRELIGMELQHSLYFHCQF